MKNAMLQKLLGVSRIVKRLGFGFFDLFVVLIIISVCLASVFRFYFRGDDLEIFFLDVGQGDAILIRSPEGKYLLVDTGPDNSVLSELGEVMPFWERKIDYMLITHPDLDHVGGAPYVLGAYDVGQVFMVDVEGTNSSYKEVKATLGGNFKDLREQNDFNLGCCVSIDVLYPFIDTDYGQIGSPNNLSTAFVLGYGKFTAFFGGDLDSEIEEEIVGRQKLDVDLLKVGHHGSSTSSSEEFLRYLSPEVSIISAGKDNRFGHPVPAVVGRLLEVGRVYSTHESGCVRVVIKDLVESPKNYLQVHFC